MVLAAAAGIALCDQARAQAPSPTPEPEQARVSSPTPSGFFIVNDNSISFHYEFSATNPGAGVTGKDVLTFNHFDVWAYGTNLLNIDWLRATNSRPCGRISPALTRTQN
jgi:hypothetical protein